MISPCRRRKGRKTPLPCYPSRTVCSPSQGWWDGEKPPSHAKGWAVQPHTPQHWYGVHAAHGVALPGAPLALSHSCGKVRKSNEIGMADAVGCNRVTQMDTQIPHAPRQWRLYDSLPPLFPRDSFSHSSHHRTVDPRAVGGVRHDAQGKGWGSKSFLLQIHCVHRHPFPLPLSSRVKHTAGRCRTPSCLTPPPVPHSPPPFPHEGKADEGRERASRAPWHAHW